MPMMSKRSTRQCGLSLYLAEQPAGEIFLAIQKSEKPVRPKKSSTESIPKKIISRPSLGLRQRPSLGLFYLSQSITPSTNIHQVWAVTKWAACAQLQLLEK